MGLKRLSIKGYRRLHQVDLDLAPLNVIIGPNGSGKTSILEVLSLLAESARGDLKDALSALGGINDLITRGKTKNLDFQITFEYPQLETLDYRLALEANSVGYLIQNECLTRTSDCVEYISAKGNDIRYGDGRTGDLNRPDWDMTPHESALSQVAKNNRDAEKCRKLLASCAFYSSYQLNLAYNAPIRLPQKVQPVSHPGRGGEALVSCLQYLRETDDLAYGLIEDTLAAAFPGFVKLAFPPVAAGAITMTWQDKHFDQPLFLNQLSEGTLRFLWLLTLLMSPELPAVVMIDEPEVSLHPHMISLLVDIMREASIRTCLIVATHSDRMVRFLDPTEVIVADMNDGLTNLTRANEMNLDHWLKDYSLDELWHMGEIGGRR